MWYTGYTDDLKKRVEEHNKSELIFIKKNLEHPEGSPEV